MTLISDIEDAIIVKLAPLKAANNCAVTKYDKTAFSRTRAGNEVFVRYLRTEPSSPQFLDNAIFQYDTLTFELVTSSLDPRSHDVAYPILEKVRKFLTGFKPVDCVKPLVMLEPEKLLTDFLENGVWIYSQIFKMTVEFTQTDNLT